MAAPALSHRILPRRFLTPPPVSSVTLVVLESKRRFHPPFPSLLSIHNNPPHFPPNFNFRVSSCLDSPSSTPRTRLNPSKRLFVSGELLLIIYAADFVDNFEFECFNFILTYDWVSVSSIRSHFVVFSV